MTRPTTSRGDRARRRLAGLMVASAVGLAPALSVFVTTAPASADTVHGEFTVGGKIEEAFDATGGVDTWGNPVMNEAAAYQGGRFQRFEKNVSFYWKASVDNGRAHYVGGAIRNKWGALGYERAALGYPRTDELDVRGKGKRQDFQGGNVYWSSSTNARVVWGEILKKWAGKGGSAGYYGLPESDEYRVGRQYAQDFQGGTILWP